MQAESPELAVLRAPRIQGCAEAMHNLRLQMLTVFRLGIMPYNTTTTTHFFGGALHFALDVGTTERI